MTRVEVSGRFEASIEYEGTAPFLVEFEHTAGRGQVEAFWDGGHTWRARFSPQATGLWRWRAEAVRAQGEFECVESPLAGPLRLSENRRHLVGSRGEPFFWLGDTVWNGPLKASAADWDEYLAYRASQGFNIVQFVAGQWISAAGDAEGRPAYLGRDPIRIEPAFFRRLDQRVDAINRHGLVAAPVLAWAAAWNPDSVHLNPGNTLNDEQLVRFIRYLTARYGAHRVVWILAGDGLYEGEEAERWRRVGRAALAGTNHLATIHPGGKLWVLDEFSNEPWFSFHGYQSGHWNDADNCRWINEGPLSRDWCRVACPQINLEPCYEGHRSMALGRVIDAHDVRRACYWSLLAAPVAGVTYGGHGLWSWESTPELPLSHPNTDIAPAWREALKFPGGESMAVLRRVFDSVPWWRLGPSPEMLAAQPGSADPERFIAAACTPERDVAIVYSPEPQSVELRAGFFPRVMRETLIDAATGAPSQRGAARDSILILREAK